MSWRRLVPLALGVTLLLAVVAVAAGGHPLGKRAGKGAGLPRTFWDYAFTTFVILEVLLMFFALVALFFLRREPAHRVSSQRKTAATLIIIILGAGLLSYIARHVDLHHLFHPGRGATTAGTATTGIGGKSNRHGHHAPEHVAFQWNELAIILAVLLVLGVLAAGSRRPLGAGSSRRSAEALADALDESLDDLRNDPDLRRAIIAAYARMEKTLAAAGLPRHHAEAPFEYLERVLLELDTSAPAVHRLTDLFEWARFSHHEPEPSMRDDAIDALVAVRDELRASELTPA